ncbi:MAG: hypothetical protein JXA54_05725 [Candidatus Heimdallarchaeota archaeon]|nr:hypothetical protein [Candidatus Heimdallarchaeota archaeon]
MSDDELDSLREKRKRELLAHSLKKELEQKKQEEAYKKEHEKGIKSSLIVNNVLESEAITYMDWLSQNNPSVAQTIRDTIILLLYKNELRKKISKIELMKIERQLTGQDSKILVKRRGKDATDLDKAIKKEE